jgi:ubiquinone/menaquinone biosynthesis C-methylase UbiE
MSLVSMIIADRLESLTKYYDRWMHLITFGQDKRVRDAVLSYVEPGDRVLDVGCGTGTLAIKAAQERARVIGIDRSPAMLKLAREKAQANEVEVDIRLAQGQPLTLRLGWVMLAILIYSFVQGYMYQGSTPVIYWKRIWK